MSDQEPPQPHDENTEPQGTPPAGDPQPAGPPPGETPSPADSAPLPADPHASPQPAATGPSPASAPFGTVGLNQGTLSEKDEKTMGLLAHILGPFTSVVGPLIIWLIKKEESPFVDDQGKEALNFQLTILIGYVATAILTMIPAVGCVFTLLFPALGIVSLIFGILGCMEANKGNAYRYPFALRLVK